MKPIFTLLALIFAVSATGYASDAPKPNIIFILSDDVGLGNISSYGGNFKTPNIDALAKGGTRFQYCYANPLCGPSRATCLTGRYVFRTGMLTNASTGEFRNEEVLVPSVLKPAGYKTAQVGKWSQLPRKPGDWGFDETITFEGSGKYWSTQEPKYYLNGKSLPLGDRYLPDVMHEFLVDFMTRNKNQPFYVYYAMSHMHGKIMRTPDSKAGRDDFYADNNAYMDKLVGQVVEALDKLGLREKTLIVFVGDNGTAQNFAAQATVDGRAITGKKGSMLEGGSRVPLIANWPGTTPAGKVSNDLTDFTDFLPTFAQLAGAKLPDAKIDGHSFAPQLLGSAGNPRGWVYVQNGEDRYVRDERWKLTGNGNLFDLKNAPFEEIEVPDTTTDAAAKEAKEKLSLVLNDLIAQDTITANAPTKTKKQRNELKKKAKQQAAEELGD